jgi:hypothetical protein
VDNLTSDSTTSALSAKQGKVLNTNKLDIAQTSYKGKNVVVDSSTGNITFENKPTIPSKVSDLTNDSGFITSSSLPTKTSELTNDGSSSSDSLVYVETSATSGLIKNDGTIDTSAYITSSSLPTKTSDLTNDGSSSSDSLVYVETSATTGLIKNDGTIDTSAYITSSALSGYLQTTDVVDSLSSTSTTAPLSANQGKVLKDLIGDAITYINQ